MPAEIKISVIVPMFNAGEALPRLVGSLDAQTLPASELEVVLVDDGSTDDTLRIAHDLAGTRPNLVVESIPNSGWPGRPRNIGIDRARGEYVFFADHDDVFGPQALSSMHAMAARAGSDVVIGKVVRIGRDTPYWSLWSADVDDADVAGSVVTSRTTHKLYRRAFLLEHGIRFREGRVRLEDHQFTARALPRANVVSVLSSVPCYYWIYRSDAAHISNTRASADEYWTAYGDVLDAFEETAGPGRLVDAARAAAAAQLFSRVSARSYLGRDELSRADTFAALHDMVARHVPPELDVRLGVLKRLRVQALREGDQVHFDALQQVRAGISFALVTDRLALRAGHLHVEVTARCQGPGGETMRPGRRDGRAVLPLDAESGIDCSAATLSDSDLGAVEITIRNQGTGVEWPVADQRCRREEDALVIHASADIDLTRDPFGAPLQTGSWDVIARTQFLGEALARTVTAVPPDDGDQALPDGIALVEGTRLAFAVGRRSEERPNAQSVMWSGRHLSVAVDDAVAAVLAGPRGGVPALRGQVIGGLATLAVDELAVAGAGLIDMWAEDIGGTAVRLGYRGPRTVCAAPGPSALTAYATAYDSLSVKTVPPAAAPQASPARRAGADTATASAVDRVAGRLRARRRGR